MKKQASSRHCFVCGVDNLFGLKLKFYESEPGHVHAETIVPEQFQGYPGVVHGGIVAAMLDEVSGRSMIRGEPPRFMVTAKMEVRYRKPVPVGKRLFLEGKAKEDSGRIATVTGAIYDEAHVLLAEVEAVLADIPKKILEDGALGPDDWKVFPDEEAAT
jgi:acyl-coenzyme A thioesterase PaaI-like protein